MKSKIYKVWSLVVEDITEVEATSPEDAAKKEFIETLDSWFDYWSYNTLYVQDIITEDIYEFCIRLDDSVADDLSADELCFLHLSQELSEEDVDIYLACYEKSRYTKNLESTQTLPGFE
jgi:hypothetical protein